MRTIAAALAVMLTTGCSLAFPVGHSAHEFFKPDDKNRSAPEHTGKFESCEIGYWLGGLAIDGTLVAADLGLGEETNGYDAILIAPLTLAALISTTTAIDCLASD